MENRNKIRLSLVGGLLLGLHFLFVLIFVAPYDWFSPKVNFVAYNYMVPLFHQNWQVFAPEPPTSARRLYLRCQFEDGTWSGWKDPAWQLLSKHHTYRISYHAKLFNIAESVADNLFHTQLRLDSELLTPTELEDKMRSMPSYQLAARYAEDQGALLFPNEQINRVEFVCFITSLNLDSGKDNSPDRTYEVLRFPVIDLNE